MNLKYFLSEVLAVPQGLQEGFGAHRNQLGVVLSAWHRNDPYVRPAAAGTLPAQPPRPWGHQPGPPALPFTKNPLLGSRPSCVPACGFLLADGNPKAGLCDGTWGASMGGGCRSPVAEAALLRAGGAGTIAVRDRVLWGWC